MPKTRKNSHVHVDAYGFVAVDYGSASPAGHNYYIKFIKKYVANIRRDTCHNLGSFSSEQIKLLLKELKHHFDISRRFDTGTEFVLVKIKDEKVGGIQYYHTIIARRPQ